MPVDETMLEGVVEVDEAFFGKQRYHNQRLVLGMLERHSRRLKLVVITDRDQDTLGGLAPQACRYHESGVHRRVDELPRHPVLRV